MRSRIENAEPLGRGKGELAHAVVDGPDGTTAVELSTDRAGALRLKARHREAFWCGRRAGGCGGGLILAAGPIRVPYFRHHPGAECVFSGDSASAARSYEHLHIQQALVAWLEKQGLSATIESQLAPDGRADLHVIVRARRHTIEVQLSPIGVNEWQRRDEGYRRQVDHVTWLYGVGAETAAATEQADRGYALHVRNGGIGTGIEVGTVTDLQENWSLLIECELRDEQFWTPHLDGAIAALAIAREDAINRAVEEKAYREALRQAEDRRRAAAAEREFATLSSPTIDHADVYGTLSWWAGTPAFAAWASEQEWSWADGLSDEGKVAVRLVSYIVSRLYASGPISMLRLPNEVATAEAVAALERARFLRRYERKGVERWERIDRPKGLDRQRFG
ncbi:hypothetical protein IFT73_01315 [Aeromicrobium sp. CFBP 8757]|uniref:competence protein CoiA family protein n=1 Tax=Aeromicrobium sp. CFBP 8757 TaxID=2775288 RepID=UPI0017850AE7|nr:competence protein CoiA family protein [Aeromicrobium sp. CFBP 8757]MBD8605479.1 hypothetical protein [Aeromicrobium sp. CFBP 8757]